MSRIRRTLVPNDLATSPELATLAMLDTVLHVTVLALVAENADLLLDRPEDRAMATTPRLCAAEAIIDQIHSLRRVLDRYRDALEADVGDPLSDDDIPF